MGLKALVLVRQILTSRLSSPEFLSYCFEIGKGTKEWTSAILRDKMLVKNFNVEIICNQSLNLVRTTLEMRRNGFYFIPKFKIQYNSVWASTIMSFYDWLLVLPLMYYGRN